MPRPDDEDKEQAMSARPIGSPSRRPRPWWRLAARLLVSAVALVGGAAIIVLLAGGSVPVAVIVRSSQVVLVILSPTLFFGTIFWAPRGIEAARRLIADHRAKRNPQPIGPPIEQIAADLRRLLWQHDTFARSHDLPMQARRLWGLEAAISDRATQAARALDVPHPDRPAAVGLGRSQLRRLLQDLAAEGLALPPTAGLLAPDSRF
jgi:hypothetical protein